MDREARTPFFLLIYECTFKDMLKRQHIILHGSRVNVFMSVKLSSEVIKSHNDNRLGKISLWPLSRYLSR